MTIPSHFTFNHRKEKQKMTIVGIILVVLFSLALILTCVLPMVNATDQVLEEFNAEEPEVDKDVEIKEILGFDLSKNKDLTAEEGLWKVNSNNIQSPIFIVTPSDTPPEICEEIESVNETISTYYNTVPLDISIQEHITDMFDKYLSYTDFVDEGGAALILAIIKVESGFKEDSIRGSCIGLMQVSTIHKEKLIKWGITNLRNPFDNIEAGIRILKECYDYASELPFSDNYTIVDMALIAYNRGVSGLLEFLETGETSNIYVDKVYKAYNEIIGGN